MMKGHKVKRKANRVQRACFNCRKRKQGCDEERPCRRCIEKGIECVEVEPKRKRGRAKMAPDASPNDNEYLSDENSKDSLYMDEDYTSDHEHESHDHRHHDHDSDKQPDMFQFFKDDVSSPGMAEVYSDFEELDDDAPLQREQYSMTSYNGVNLALLLPLLCNNIGTDSDSFFGESQNHTYDDPNIESLGSSPPSGNTFAEWEILGANSSFLPENHFPSFDLEMTDVENSSHVKDCWKMFSSKMALDENLHKEFNRAKESWKEIMDALRNLDWNRVQTCLQDIDVTEDPTSAVVFWSPGGRIHHANSTFCKMVGYNVQDLRVASDGVDKIRVHALFHPDETMKILSRQLDALNNPTQGSFHLKTRLLSKMRKEIPVDCSISNLHDRVNGTPLLTMAHFVVQDMDM